VNRDKNQQPICAQSPASRIIDSIAFINKHLAAFLGASADGGVRKAAAPIDPFNEKINLKIAITPGSLKIVLNTC
jgi:hypothetical protein